jgi:hypothetical protein
VLPGPTIRALIRDSVRPFAKLGPATSAARFNSAETEPVQLQLVYPLPTLWCNPPESLPDAQSPTRSFRTNPDTFISLRNSDVCSTLIVHTVRMAHWQISHIEMWFTCSMRKEALSANRNGDLAGIEKVHKWSIEECMQRETLRVMHVFIQSNSYTRSILIRQKNFSMVLRTWEPLRFHQPLFVVGTHGRTGSNRIASSAISLGS